MDTTNKQILRLSPNFSASENWGLLRKINPALIVLMQHIRRGLGLPIRINCAYETGGHSNNSQHYLGNAVDFSVNGGANFVSTYNIINDILILAEMQDEVGFGVYPFWNTPGFHIDVRGSRARWGMAKNKDYVGIDIAIHDFEND